MKCPHCNSEKDYSNIGNHWRQSCEYPEPSKSVEETLDGLLMGDGCLKRTHLQNERTGNQSIEVISINKRFIDHLYQDYTPFFNEPTVKISAKKAARNAMDSSVVSSPDGSVFRTQYGIVSKAVPFFNKYDEWKRSGEKRWPEDIKFTPTRLKYLYACDGGLSWNKNSRSARSQLTSSTESQRLCELRSLLQSLDIECSVYSDRIMMKPSTTDRFLDYLGDPVPGFEYKWCNNDLGLYEQKRRKVYYREGHTHEI